MFLSDVFLHPRLFLPRSLIFLPFDYFLSFSSETSPLSFNKFTIYFQTVVSTKFSVDRLKRIKFFKISTFYTRLIRQKLSTLIRSPYLFFFAAISRVDFFHSSDLRALIRDMRVLTEVSDFYRK